MSSKENIPEIEDDISAPKTEDSVDSDYIEQELKHDAHDIDNDIKTIEREIEKIGVNDQERNEYLRDKLVRTVKKYTKIISLAASLAAVGLAVNYERTRYEVTVANDDSSSSDGVKYIHEDEETNRIIEYLAGKRDLDDETKFKIARKKIINMLEGNNISCPSNMENMIRSEFEKEILIIFKGHEEEYRKSFIDSIRNGNWVDDFLPKISYDNPNQIYKGLWEVERMSGNPKIRLGMIDELSDKLVDIGDGRAYYNFLTNTVHVFDLEDYLKETSHSLQMQRAPISTIIEGINGYIDTIKAYPETHDIKTAYGKTYHISGDVEHEAHYKVEPEIRRRFQKTIGDAK